MRYGTVAIVGADGVACSCPGPGPAREEDQDGIFVQAAKAQDSNVSIVLTNEGVVMIDTGQTPVDSSAAMGP